MFLQISGYLSTPKNGVVTEKNTEKTKMVRGRFLVLGKPAAHIAYIQHCQKQEKLSAHLAVLVSDAPAVAQEDIKASLPTVFQWSSHC